jgi:hypothetical protein
LLSLVHSRAPVFCYILIVAINVTGLFGADNVVAHFNACVLFSPRRAKTIHVGFTHRADFYSLPAVFSPYGAKNSRQKDKAP